MLGNNSSRRTSSRSARLSSSISHTVATRRQRPTAKIRLTDRPKSLRQTSAAKSSRKSPAKKSPQKSPFARRKKSSRLRLERPKLAAPEYSLLGILAMSCLCIAVSLITVASFDPARDAENAMSTLADDYYIEFLYPRSLGAHINDPATILSRYAETGLPSVRLNQLLLYNDGSHVAYTRYFDNKYYKCDIGHSFLTFYPVAPYGPRDYTVRYSADCEKVL